MESLVRPACWANVVVLQSLVVAGSFDVIFLKAVVSDFGLALQTNGRSWLAVCEALPCGALCEGMYCLELFVSIPSCWFGVKNAWEGCYGVPFHAPEGDLVPTSVIAKAYSSLSVLLAVALADRDAYQFSATGALLDMALPLVLCASGAFVFAYFWVAKFTASSPGQLNSGFLEYWFVAKLSKKMLMFSWHRWGLIIWGWTEILGADIIFGWLMLSPAAGLLCSVQVEDAESGLEACCG
ncbi:hypothetical protein Nepgr_007859 [Nepenthes gracilis]|uniref:Uncharacterized protein n=1 Tax=Nepenthes gracilis TaxID=150966 RepID=A0AAD3S7W3_NEPGR|nr:hypothetical protein Nepgr_007859 [Nepenthes gracilis]